MKSKLTLIAAVGLGLSTTNHPLSTALAQGTAFTYEGQLNNNGSPANGIYDIRAGLYLASTGGTVFAGPLTNPAVAVSNGLFSITLDYGPVFDGTTYWLEVGVRSNGLGGFTILSPRQELTPTPYAIFAEGANAAGLSGTIPPGSLAGGYSGAVNLTNPANSFAGNGAGLTNVNAVTLDGLAANQFWQLSGNAGTTPGVNFVGTTDNQPLDLYVDNVRAMRLVLRNDSTGTYSNAPNVIGGSSVNAVKTGVVGGTVGGGGGDETNGVLHANKVNANFGTVSGGFGNNASGAGSFIGGGGYDGNPADSVGNDASGAASVIGGGLNNTNSGYASTIGGGFQNNAASSTSGFFYGGATVGGGTANKATTDQATVGGGFDNTASGFAATVPGGTLNVAAGIGSFAAGQSAQTTHNGTFIWGDGTQVFNGENVDNGFNVLSTGGVFFYDGTNGVHIDALGNNDGALDFGLKFGGALSSGEGIASKRTAGGNQFGLDFYTSSNNRMSVAQNGFVGINTTSPSERLEVNGNYILVDGGNAVNNSGAIDAYIGGDGSGSDVQIGSMNSLITAVGFWNHAANAWMHISCSSITIHGGADLAEPFQLTADASDVSAGAVVVIDAENPGRLKLSEQAYDARVAGVVSGANGVNPGIQMQQQGLLEGGKNVALTGRVYVRADTSNGAIKPGDLLTTSAIPGRAMKVTDHTRAQGAILGKAMTGLDKDQGMVLVLVTLQ